MLPVFKETVEELFEAGLVKVVFATETLSLGINMPAKTVVIEDLWKFQGERHELLTPGEYTQLTGRAGRRGIDEVGHAVVLYQRQVDFERVATLAQRRTYDLVSSFRPSYNMAVNLARNYTEEQAHHLLNSSFGQFLADRKVVGLERELQRDDRGDRGVPREHALPPRRLRRVLVAGCRRPAVCARTIARATRRRGPTRSARRWGSSAPGEVIAVPNGKRGGLGVIVSSREGKPTVLTQDRRFFRLAARDFPDPPAVLTRIPLPRSGSARSSRYRRDVAAKLVSLRVRPPKAAKHRADPEGRAGSREARGAGGGAPLPSLPRARQARTVGEAGGRARGVALLHPSGASGSGPRPSRGSSIGCSACCASSATSTAGT